VSPACRCKCRNQMWCDSQVDREKGINAVLLLWGLVEEWEGSAGLFMGVDQLDCRHRMAAVEG